MWQCRGRAGQAGAGLPAPAAARRDRPASQVAAAVRQRDAHTVLAQHGRTGREAAATA